MRTRDTVEKRGKRREGKGGTDRTPRVVLFNNSKVQGRIDSIHAKNEVERGEGGRKNGARTGYRITVYRTNISLLLDQTFYPLFFSFSLSSRFTPEGETQRAKTGTSNNAHLKVAKDRLRSTRGRAACSFWWGYGISHAAPQDKPERRSVHGVRRNGGEREGEGEG